MPVRREVVALVAALATPLVSPAVSAAPAPELGPGTFTQINPGTHHVMPLGNQVVFVRGKGGRLSFSVSATRGGEITSNFAVGTLPAGGRSVTWTRRSAAGNCRLTFEAQPNLGLHVHQDAGFGDCGWGAGILADGTYVRTRAEPAEIDLPKP